MAQTKDWCELGSSYCWDLTSIFMVGCETKRELSLQTRVNGGVRVILKSVKAVSLVVSVNLLIKISLNIKSPDSILKLDIRLYMS